MSVGILTTVCTVALVAGSMWVSTDLPVPPLPRPAVTDTNDTPAVSTGVPEHPTDDLDAGPHEHELVDSYGNEVTRAIASYKFDPTGALYEEHSPHTEIPRLGMPKS